VPRLANVNNRQRLERWAQLVCNPWVPFRREFEFTRQQLNRHRSSFSTRRRAA